MEGNVTYRIVVWGLVQGVGFRPFVYRLATEMGLRGWVNNTNENVQVCVNADRKILQEFIEQIREQAPPASQIQSIDCAVTDDEEFTDFRIIKSESLSEAVTHVSPDIAVCEECLRDMKRQPNRINYPFLNCTNCGPRFTIVRDLPYDRANTAMKEFVMCPACRGEYENVADRRFHAQPTACWECGPVFTLAESFRDGSGTDEAGREGIPGNKLADRQKGKDRLPEEGEEIINRTARLIDRGKIVSVKGLGGFFMACDARDEQAVSRLRDSKQREGKPFAVMFRDTRAVREVCTVSPAEQAELESWRRPIVILRNRETGKGNQAAWQPAPSVSNGFPTTGAMLPYMPLHYLLFDKLNTPAIVLTSGNLAEEPIIIDNGRAEQVLGSVSDAVLHYNRDIHNRCDDSVAMVAGEQTRLLRRSRGYAPDPIRLDLDAEGIFAAGAELVNCFALGKGKQAVLSQHIGDLKNFETYEFYRETFGRFKRLFRLEPVLVAHDLHPDYLSTRFAAELGLPAVPVQHHHAHIASVLAEHRLDETVIGVSFDGTGLGDDGNIWGSEFLVCDLEAYERITHLEYIPMPGGDMATHEPWRLAVSCLYSLFGRDFTGLGLPFLEGIDPSTLDLVIRSIEKNINCPLSSGAGRFFDAVAAMLGLCTVSLFHAEAPMRLEAAIIPDGEYYPFADASFASNSEGNGRTAGPQAISLMPTFQTIAGDIGRGTDPGRIAARFHNTITEIILETVTRIGSDRKINKVVLAGGTFQNRYLCERAEPLLREAGFEVMVPGQLPSNDGGIALGQLAIAAKRRSAGLV